MAKTLKDFLNERQLGPMVVKNPDEQKFIDKHVVAKTADRNGNDDEVFKGSKVKMADRKKERHGYNPGEDEDVYEELKGAQHKIDANKNGKVDAHDFHLLRKKKKVAEEAEELEELSKGTLGRYITKATVRKGQHDYEAGKAMGGEDYDDVDDHLDKSDKREKGINKAVKKLTKEEAEELEELSTEKLLAYRKKAREADTNKHHVYADEADKKIKKKTGVYNPNLLQRAKAKLRNEEAEELEELSKDTVRNYFNKGGEQGKKITDKMKMSGGDWTADGSATKTLRKRAAGRAMAYKRRTGEIKMSEDSEQIDETSNAYRDRFGPGGINDKKRAAMHMLTPDDTGSTAKARTPEEHKTRHNEFLNIASNKNTTLAQLGKMAAHSYKVYHDIDKLAKEEVEIEEKLDIKKASMGTVVKDFKTANAPQFKGKSESKRRVMAIAAKLSAERGGKPLNKEERLLTKLADISETHQRTMVSIFEKLNEDNKSKFLNACNTPEGVENMLDFAINNRGE